MEGEKSFCGVERDQLFSKCIVPVLTTLCQNDGQNRSMVDLITKIVNQISNVESNSSEEDDEVQPSLENQQDDHKEDAHINNEEADLNIGIQ